MYNEQFSLLLCHRSYSDLMRMRNFIESGYDPRIITELYDTRLYFGRECIPSMEGIFSAIKDTISAIWGIIKKIVKSVLGLFGIKSHDTGHTEGDIKNMKHDLKRAEASIARQLLLLKLKQLHEDSVKILKEPKFVNSDIMSNVIPHLMRSGIISAKQFSEIANAIMNKNYKLKIDSIKLEKAETDNVLKIVKIAADKRFLDSAVEFFEGIVVNAEKLLKTGEYLSKNKSNTDAATNSLREAKATIEDIKEAIAFADMLNTIGLNKACLDLNMLMMFLVPSSIEKHEEFVKNFDDPNYVIEI